MSGRGCWLSAGCLLVAATETAAARLQLSAEAATDGQAGPDTMESMLNRSPDVQQSVLGAKEHRRSLSKDALPRTDARSVLNDGRPELQVPEALEPLLEFHVNPAIVLGDAMHLSEDKISPLPALPLTVDMADRSCAE